jgi:hypothetical protein
MWHQKPALVDNAQKISTVRAAMRPRENKPFNELMTGIAAGSSEK